MDDIVERLTRYNHERLKFVPHLGIEIHSMNVGHEREAHLTFQDTIDAATEITKLREQVEVMRVALAYYSSSEHYDGGDVPGHIYVLDDHGRTATQAIAKVKEVGVSEWRPIESAPYGAPVRIKAGDMTFLATLEPDASMSDMDTTCDQWQAVNEGEHPPCWSDGACWESNEDEICSLQPEAWQPINN